MGSQKNVKRRKRLPAKQAPSRMYKLPARPGRAKPRMRKLPARPSNRPEMRKLPARPAMPSQKIPNQRKYFKPKNNINIIKGLRDKMNKRRRYA